MNHVGAYVDLLRAAERALADSFRRVAGAHPDECDVDDVCAQLAAVSDDHAGWLDRLAARYPTPPAGEPEPWHAPAPAVPRPGLVGLVRDLQDLHALSTLVATCWAVLCQAAHGARDRDLLGVAEHCGAGTARQVAWLSTRIRQLAPQALLAGA